MANRAINRCSDLASDFHYPLTDIDYADDDVLFANSVALLADALTKLSEKVSPLGLSISWIKTKHQSSVFVNDNEVETVDNFIYLGRIQHVESNLRVAPLVAFHVDGGARRLQFEPGSAYSTPALCRSCCTAANHGPHHLPPSIVLMLTTVRVDAYHRSCLRYILGIRWFDHI